MSASIEQMNELLSKEMFSSYVAMGQQLNNSSPATQRRFVEGMNAMLNVTPLPLSQALLVSAQTSPQLEYDEPEDDQVIYDDRPVSTSPSPEKMPAAAPLNTSENKEQKTRAPRPAPTVNAQLRSETMKAWTRSQALKRAIPDADSREKQSIKVKYSKIQSSEKGSVKKVGFFVQIEFKDDPKAARANNSTSARNGR